MDRGPTAGQTAGLQHIQKQRKPIRELRRAINHE